MDSTLTLSLSISILINILALRWAYREHAARRRYQQETRVLRQALRGIHPEISRNPGLEYWLTWLIVGMFLVGMVWWLLQ